MKKESSNATPVAPNPALKAKLKKLEAAYRETARQFESLENDPESLFIGLQLQALHEIGKAMEKEGVSRSELARRMGCSRQNITQIFSDEANFKLEMVARIAAALNRDVAIRLMEKDEEAVVRPARAASTPAKPRAARPMPKNGDAVGERTRRALARTGK